MVEIRVWQCGCENTGSWELKWVVGYFVLCDVNGGWVFVNNCKGFVLVL